MRRRRPRHCKDLFSLDLNAGELRPCAFPNEMALKDGPHNQGSSNAGALASGRWRTRSQVTTSQSGAGAVSQAGVSAVQEEDVGMAEDGPVASRLPPVYKPEGDPDHS